VDLIDDRFDTFRELLADRPVDVAHLTVFYVNVLQHFFWRDDVTKRAWKVIDEHIGEVRDAYPDATLYLMSDHGCTDVDTVFHANSWLEQEGYLVTRRRVRRTRSRRSGSTRSASHSSHTDSEYTDSSRRSRRIRSRTPSPRTKRGSNASRSSKKLTGSAATLSRADRG